MCTICARSSITRPTVVIYTNAAMFNKPPPYRQIMHRKLPRNKDAKRNWFFFFLTLRPSASEGIKLFRPSKLRRVNNDSILYSAAMMIFRTKGVILHGILLSRVEMNSGNLVTSSRNQNGINLIRNREQNKNILGSHLQFIFVSLSYCLFLSLLSLSLFLCHLPHTLKDDLRTKTENHVIPFCKDEQRYQ